MVLDWFPDIQNFPSWEVDEDEEWQLVTKLWIHHFSSLHNINHSYNIKWCKISHLDYVKKSEPFQIDVEIQFSVNILDFSSLPLNLFGRRFKTVSLKYDCWERWGAVISRLRLIKLSEQWDCSSSKIMASQRIKTEETK